MPRVFKVHSCIGRGGFGEVYLASVYAEGEESRSVALKILHADVDPRSHAVQRLRDESRMLRMLDHPNILKAQDLAVIDGRVALVTEFVEGDDLAGLAKNNPLPPGPALEVVERLADALHDAQTHEVDGAPLDLVHRDVKPENVRIGHAGEVRLLDFGVARTERIDREAHTATDVVMGSLPFLAPEILSTGRSDHASDVYALGVTLYYALVGKRLFTETGPELFDLLLHADRFEKRLDERLATFSDADIAALVRDMVRHDPAARPSHAEIRDRARALRATREPDLRSWCTSCTFPESKSLPGLLSGHVFEEQLVDPGSITASHSGARALDPDGHSLTEVNDFEEPTELDPKALRADLEAAPPETYAPTPIIPEPAEPPPMPLPVRRGASPTTGRHGPTRTQLALVLTGIAMLMGVGFVGAFAAGTLLLP